MANTPNNYNFTQMDSSLLSSGSLEDGNILVSGFEEEDLMDFTRKIWAVEKNPTAEAVFIWVSSYGGNVHNCLAMIDLIETINKPVYTIALGKAMSAGCLLVAAGPKNHRFITPNTYMMVHEVSGGATGKTQDIIQQASEVTDLNNRLIELLAQYCKKRPAQLKKLIQKIHNTDLVLDAENSKKFGLVDHVGIPKIRVSRTPQEVLLVRKEK